MKIAVIHDWHPDFFQELTWTDGLAAAIKILGTRHEVKFFTCGTSEFVMPHPYFPIYFTPPGDTMKQRVKEFAPDVILHWADMTRENAEPLKTLGLPMAICFAGGNPFGPTWHLFDHIFVESQSYKGAFENAGLSVSTAFGTNTELFKPLPDIQKKFDVIFPATFCNWKRHKLFTDSTQGLNTICTGFMYTDHEVDCWQYPQKNGVLTLPHVSADTLRHLYAASKCCLITSHWTGGSQRTVLEAMAMNIPLVVMSDSDKTSEYVNECGQGIVANPEPSEIRQAVIEMMGMEVSTRDYVLSKWSEHNYADAIEAGLKKIV
jgi:glycosyltransferase involved in cell wall biosynthesis